LFKSLFILLKKMQMRKFLLLLLGVLMISSHLLAQTRTVSGRITDAQGGGIPNASVTVKGTSVGTTTDANGSFSLSVPANARTLVISSVGFQNQEFNLSTSNTVSVTMTATEGALDEVVVVAYGTQRRGAFTGSVAQVGAKELENRPITNALNALVGAAPGIQTSTPSGAPGSSPGYL
jgi:hypothetical protein